MARRGPTQDVWLSAFLSCVRRCQSSTTSEFRAVFKLNERSGVTERTITEVSVVWSWEVIVLIGQRSEENGMLG